MENRIPQSQTAYSHQSTYNFDNAVILNEYPKRIMQKLSGAHQTLLELGLGHGYAALKFEPFFSRHVVLEGDPQVIAQFKENYADFSGDIVQTYFEDFVTDQRFDVIVLGFVLEHVENPASILRHYQNFLAKNGRMFITVPNALTLNRRIGHLAGMLPDIYQLSENDIQTGHRRYYDVQTIKDECRQVGLDVISIEGLFLKPVTTAQMLQLNLNERIVEAFAEMGRQYPELSLGILAEVQMI